MNRKAILLLSLLVACAPAPADTEFDVETETITYEHEGATLEGFLARPVGDGPFPGALVYHAWMGIGDHEREWASRLAKRGYVAFCPDIYGKGIRPKNREEAGAQAGKYRGDRALMRARARAGMEVLFGQPGVDPERAAALGFCFGGGTVLELARSGAPLDGFVSLHGNLDTPDPSDAKRVKGRILVLHGAADPHVPWSQVEAFQQEMDAAGVDWTMIAYGGAVHAFSDPGAGDDPSRGAAYDESAARRSWEATTRLFHEVTAE